MHCDLSRAPDSWLAPVQSAHTLFKRTPYWWAAEGGGRRHASGRSAGWRQGQRRTTSCCFRPSWLGEKCTVRREGDSKDSFFPQTQNKVLLWLLQARGDFKPVQPRGARGFSGLTAALCFSGNSSCCGGLSFCPVENKHSFTTLSTTMKCLFLVYLLWNTGNNPNTEKKSLSYTSN